ncbi:tRNA-guanine transglycosylase, partial [Candidatus Falkowbacteria bacterium]|nr:tRNA-guanine transglycosylase [Candidatus Falkowbacteria bacterium]
GGVHKFMNWNGPLLSDSGGYQVFSLIHKNSKMGKITDKGAFFNSPIDGSKHVLTPEKSIEIQFDLGVDMMVVLDDCPPYGHSKKKMKEAVDRTISWAQRCKLEYERQIEKRKIKAGKPLLFGVIQGGLHKDLRKRCALGLLNIGFDGYGFGGRPVDDKGNFIADILKYTADLIPKDKLKFALGIGTPKDIAKCAKMGWNMFDCVIPTREGRHGRLFYEQKRGYKTVNINNVKFSSNMRLIYPDSKSKDLRELSFAYLHHLFKINDPYGARLASLKNLEFYNAWMNKVDKR